jgi:hypothetical protein
MPSYGLLKKLEVPRAPVVKTLLLQAVPAPKVYPESNTPADLTKDRPERAPPEMVRKPRVHSVWRMFADFVPQPLGSCC